MRPGAILYIEPNAKTTKPFFKLIIIFAEEKSIKTSVSVWTAIKNWYIRTKEYISSQDWFYIPKKAYDVGL